MFCSLLINSFIMKILFCLFVLIHIHSVRVTSRTLRSNGNELVNSELEAVRSIRPKSEDHIIWTKVELKPHRGVHIDLDGNEETNPEMSAENLKSYKKETSEERVTTVETVETWSEKGEPLRTKSLLTENNAREPSIEFHGNHGLVANNTGLNEFSDAANSTNIGNLSTSLLPEPESGNFSDSVVFDFVDLNEHATVVDTLIKNISLKESVETNDTLMSEEDEIVFQEVPTFGFEFLIDSQMTRNLLLSELLSSESVLITQDDSEELATLLLDEENTTLETVVFDLNEEESEFNSPLIGEETNALLSTKTGVEELENENIKLNESGVHSVVTEQNEITEKITPCPDPGWCFLWFLSQDTCAEDNHCLGSRICCKSGCSKTCIDI